MIRRVVKDYFKMFRQNTPISFARCFIHIYIYIYCFVYADSHDHVIFVTIDVLNNPHDVKSNSRPYCHMAGFRYSVGAVCCLEGEYLLALGCPRLADSTAGAD